jgi:hypothetical protein
MDCWSNGVLGLKAITPILHYSSVILLLMLDLAGALAPGKGHIQCHASNDRLPRLILRQPLSSNGAPEKDYLFFRHILEKVLLAFT